MTIIKQKTIGNLFLERIEKTIKTSTSNNNAIGWIESNSVKFISFEQYKNSVEIITLALNQIGLKPQQKVAIFGKTSKEWHLFDMGLLCGDFISVPIYPNLISKDFEYIFNHSGCVGLIIDSVEQFKKVSAVLPNLTNLKFIISFCDIPVVPNIQVYHSNEIFNIGKEELKIHPDVFETNIKNQSENSIATIIYTSGTTGIPKGAVISQKAIVSMLHNIYSTTKGAFSNSDRTLTFLPLSHVFGRCDSLLILIFSWETVYAESIDKILDNIVLVKPTIMLAVPRIFEKIYEKVMRQIQAAPFYKKSLFDWCEKVSNDYFEKIQHDLSPTPKDILQRQIAYNLFYKKIYENFGGRIRFFVSGGSPLSVTIINFLRNANLTVIEGYGLTETVAPCAINPLYKQIPGTVGIPVGDVQFKFSPENEILIKSEALLTEYYNNPEATADALKDGWFYTGDIGQFSPEGYLTITDRKKDIIITSAGKNIAPQKIENLMKLQKHISHFVTIGDKKPFLTGIVGIEKERFSDLFEQLGLSKNCDIKDIAENPTVRELIKAEIDTANKELSNYETIKHFFICPDDFSVENSALTPSLKLKRNLIIARYKDEIDAMYNL